MFLAKLSSKNTSCNDKTKLPALKSMKGRTLVILEGPIALHTICSQTKPVRTEPDTPTEKDATLGTPTMIM